MNKIKQKLHNWALSQSKRVFIWTEKVKVYSGGGFPKFRWTPYIYNCSGDSYWGMFKFCICIFGQEFFFSFGKDKNGFYKDTKIVNNYTERI